MIVKLLKIANKIDRDGHYYISDKLEKLAANYTGFTDLGNDTITGGNWQQDSQGKYWYQNPQSGQWEQKDTLPSNPQQNQTATLQTVTQPEQSQNEQSAQQYMTGLGIAGGAAGLGAIGYGAHGLSQFNQANQTYKAFQQAVKNRNPQQAAFYYQKLKEGNLLNMSGFNQQELDMIHNFGNSALQKTEKAVGGAAEKAVGNIAEQNAGGIAKKFLPAVWNAIKKIR